MGRLKKNGSGSSVRTGLRIRHEIVNIIYRNPQVSVKIPTSMELARHFNVARCTVTDELKKLTNEGLLIGKRGIGTFSNPSAMSFYSQMPGKNIIGILVGDSQMFYQDYTSWVLSAAAGTALLPDIGHPRNISLNEQNPELMYEELRLLNLDGIIWILPPPKMAPYLQKLRNGGMPVVTLYENLPEIPGIKPDFKQQGKDLAKILFRENKPRVAWCAFDPWSVASMEEAQQYFTEQGIKLEPSLVLTNPGELEQKLEALLNSSRKLDVIYIHGELAFIVINMLKKHNIDPFRDILLISGYGAIRKMSDFKGIIRHYPLQEMGNEAAEIMKKLFDGTFDEKMLHQTKKIKLEFRK